MANQICTTETYDDVIHIEVLLKSQSTACSKDLVLTLNKYLSTVSTIRYDNQILLNQINDDYLNKNITSITIDSNDNYGFDTPLNLNEKNTKIHVYRLSDPIDSDVLNLSSEESDMNVTSGYCGQNANVSSSKNWLLPNQEFHNLWETLIYENHIKSNLLDYSQTTMLFARLNVDPNIVCWNKVLLLHGKHNDIISSRYPQLVSKSAVVQFLTNENGGGPPGTGKTSLCKALSQKIMIRLSDQYSYGYLIEINSHSLFSKWFSESGKLVQKMFDKINDILCDPKSLIFVLIDEVESLAAARSCALSGSEPSDSMRVVNAMLTQLDQIKKYPNILILTTSNISGALDLAFVDRADLKIYIGLPTPEAIFNIYHNCMLELMQVGIIKPKIALLDLKCLKLMHFQEQAATSLSLKLFQVAQMSVGLSGRSIRKLPFLAHAFYIKKNLCNMEEFIMGLEKMVLYKQDESKA